MGHLAAVAAPAPVQASAPPDALGRQRNPSCLRFECSNLHLSPPSAAAMCIDSLLEGDPVPGGPVEVNFADHQRLSTELRRGSSSAVSRVSQKAREGGRSVN